MVLPLVVSIGASAPPVNAGERKTVNTDYTLVRSDPGAYVVGIAFRGDTVDVQQDESGGYRWGLVYRLGICAWTYGGALTQGGSVADVCRHDPPRSVDGFTNGQVGSDSTGNDGAPATLTPSTPGCQTYPDGSVPGYGNVRPWLVPAQPSEQLPGVALTGVDVVRWRYVSADGGWVMVHVPSFGDTDGVGVPSWFFVQRPCVSF
jgi:hypothetical protein